MDFFRQSTVFAGQSGFRGAFVGPRPHHETSKISMGGQRHGCRRKRRRPPGGQGAVCRRPNAASLRIRRARLAHRVLDGRGSGSGLLPVRSGLDMSFSFVGEPRASVGRRGRRRAAGRAGRRGGRGVARRRGGHHRCSGSVRRAPKTDWPRSSARASVSIAGCGVGSRRCPARFLRGGPWRGRGRWASGLRAAGGLVRRARRKSGSCGRRGGARCRERRRRWR